MPYIHSDLPAVEVMAQLRDRCRAENLSVRDLYSEDCAKVGCKKNSELLRILPGDPGDYNSLKELNLNLNCVGKKGVKALLNVIIVCTGLKRILLADNFLTNESVKELVWALHDHPGVEEIDLRKNPISHNAGKLLSEFIGSHPKVTTVHLTDTLINPALIRIIQRKAVENCGKVGKAPVESMLQDVPRATYIPPPAAVPADSVPPAAATPTPSPPGPTPLKVAAPHPDGSTEMVAAPDHAKAVPRDVVSTEPVVSGPTKANESGKHDTPASDHRNDKAGAVTPPPPPPPPPPSPPPLQEDSQQTADTPRDVNTARKASQEKASPLLPDEIIRTQSTVASPEEPPYLPTAFRCAFPLLDQLVAADATGLPMLQVLAKVAVAKAKLPIEVNANEDWYGIKLLYNTSLLEPDCPVQSENGSWYGIHLVYSALACSDDLPHDVTSDQHLRKNRAGPSEPDQPPHRPVSPTPRVVQPLTLLNTVSKGELRALSFLVSTESGRSTISGLVGVLNETADCRFPALNFLVETHRAQVSSPPSHPLQSSDVDDRLLELAKGLTPHDEWYAMNLIWVLASSGSSKWDGLSSVMAVINQSKS